MVGLHAHLDMVLMLQIFALQLPITLEFEEGQGSHSFCGIKILNCIQ